MSYSYVEKNVSVLDHMSRDFGQDVYGSVYSSEETETGIARASITKIQSD